MEMEEEGKENLSSAQKAMIITTPNCPVCGSPVEPEENKCSSCGAAYQFISKEEKEKVLEEFKELPGLGHLKATALYDSGVTSMDKLTSAKKKELEDIDGFGKKLAGKIYYHLHPDESPEEGEEKEDQKALAQWLDSEGDEDALEEWLSDQPEEGAVEGKVKKEASAKENEDIAATPTTSTQAGEEEESVILERWLQGEEDALEEWLSEEEGKDTVQTEEKLSMMEELKEKEEVLKDKEEELDHIKGEMELLKQKLQETLSAIDTGEFDPMKLTEENAKLRQELIEEKTKREQAEGQLNDVKKGSIAVLKYVQAQKGGDGAAGVGSADQDELFAELKERDELISSLREQLDEKLSELPEDQKVLKEKELELIEKEKEIELKQNKIEIREREVANREKAVPQGAAEASGEGGEVTEEYLDQLQQMNQTVTELRTQLDEMTIENKQLKDQLERVDKPAGEVEKELEMKVRELEVKEKSMSLRENEIGRLQEQITFLEDEMKKIKEPLKYKEEELLRREEDLVYREQMLQEERNKLDMAKEEAGGSLEVLDAKRKIEDLKREINKKEEEIRTKEKFLRQKEEEMRLRERGLIGEEIEAREEDRALELSIKKAKSGTARLDDLLYGGLPFGTNMLVYGAPFIGKEVLINVFIAEGLKKGIPAIWVLTDKTPQQIREEMQFIVSGYEEYEKLGLVRYVDSYSRGMGEEPEKDKNATFVSESTAYHEILEAVNKYGKEFKEKYDYYRLGFRSVSTLIAYLDRNTSLKFLQPFTGIRKRENAISLFALEEGMHTDAEIQLIGHLMDGSVDFKVEADKKTYLAVRGVVPKAQSRDYVKYTYSRQGLTIGSFALDKIR